MSKKKPKNQTLPNHQSNKARRYYQGGYIPRNICIHAPLFINGYTLQGKCVADLDYEKDKPIILLQDMIIPDVYHRFSWGYYVQFADYSVPETINDIEFWHDILNDLAGKKKKITVSCTGSHGRTGTVLAILAYLINPDIPDIINYIRSQYCKEAIESISQINYLRKLGINTFNHKRPSLAWEESKDTSIRKSTANTNDYIDIDGVDYNPEERVWYVDEKTGVLTSTTAKEFYDSDRKRSKTKK